MEKITDEYAPYCFFVSETIYDGFDAAIKTNGFMPRFRDFFKNITNDIEAIGHKQTQEDLREILLEYPKAFVDPCPGNTGYEVMEKVRKDFETEKAIKLPFPKMSLFVGVLLDVKQVEQRTEYGGYAEAEASDGKKFDAAYIVFLEQINDEGVRASVFVAKGAKRLEIKLHRFIMGINKEGKVGSLSGSSLNELQTRSLVLEVLYAIHKLTFPNEGVYISKPTPREIQVNKKKLKKRKAPLIEFRLIKIEPTKPQLPSLPQGTHASPRQHWRRGHWRNCKSGKRVFVNPALIGDEKNGKIIKDYIVGEPTHAH